MLRAVLNFYLLLADKLPALIGCSCIVEEQKGIIKTLKAQNKPKRIVILFCVLLFFCKINSEFLFAKLFQQWLSFVE